MFSLVKNGDLWYYQIDEFSKTQMVRHCFTTRNGGVSSGAYESMNLRVNCDDSKDNIMKNYGIICDEIGVDIKSLVLSKQVHKTDIIDVDSSLCGNGLFFENRFESADALVTAEKGVTLVTFYADCVPVFLLDRRKGVLALIHSGWKGTASGINALTAEHMIKKYSSNPEDIIAAIGPSIQECHFEVGDEVAEIFRDKFGSSCVKSYGEKQHVNLQKCIRAQLTKSGIDKKNITDSGICTYCSDLFYSHRRMGNERGTMAAIACLI